MGERSVAGSFGEVRDEGLVLFIGVGWSLGVCRRSLSGPGTVENTESTW